MTREIVKALSDADLQQIGIWAREETQERASRLKQETIEKIRALAATVGVAVKVAGNRGRAPKAVAEHGAIRRKRKTSA